MPIQNTLRMTKSVLLQVADDAEFDVLIGGLAHQIAAEQQTRGDLVGLQLANQVIAIEGRILAHADGKSEPAGLGIGRAFRQQQTIFAAA